MLNRFSIISNKNRAAHVPMLMYHSVVDANDNWIWRHLSCPVSIFESHLKALRKARFRTISTQLLYEHMTEGRDIPPRSVILTFDDGYLDNWVYAYPLLKKYGFQGTIFINPEFVDPAQHLRPNLEDVWHKRASIKELPTRGFLSWREMEEMEYTGVMDIQSHGLTHTWYFSSDQIIDFHHPGDAYMWLAWNARPERKYLWMTEKQHSFVPWGVPVYQYEKSLAARRYLPDENLTKVLVNYVKENGEQAFFESSDWHQTLLRVHHDYRQTFGDHGRFETDAEYKQRLFQELNESKRTIENQLNKTVNFLCWPGGGYNTLSIKISKEVGYYASTLSSRERDKKNAFGEAPSRWGRTSPPMFMWSPTNVEYKGGLHLVALLHLTRGSILYTILYKVLRVPFKLTQWFDNILQKFKQ